MKIILLNGLGRIMPLETGENIVLQDLISNTYSILYDRTPVTASKGFAYDENLHESNEQINARTPILK